MTVVDVNTGKFTGQGGNLEETVTRNNLEAAEEIVRQLRLRDVGGIVVIDFIDMVLESNRELVLRRLLECLARDRTKHQVAEVTSLGLVQMTRKRVGAGLLEAFSTPCECCNGRGVILTFDPDTDTPAPHHLHARGNNGGGNGGNGGNGARTAAQVATSVAARTRQPDAPRPDNASQPDNARQVDSQAADGSSAVGEAVTARPDNAQPPSDAQSASGQSGDAQPTSGQSGNGQSGNGQAPNGSGEPGRSSSSGRRRRRRPAASAASAATAVGSTASPAPAASVTSVPEPPQAQDGAA
jgi:ribonuclease E